TDDAPGPPLNANVTGRSLPGMVYAVNTTSPVTSPFSSRTGSEPTVAVYLSVLPSTAVDCATCASAGNGVRWKPSLLAAGGVAAGLWASAASAAALRPTATRAVSRAVCRDLRTDRFLAGAGKFASLTV